MRLRLQCGVCGEASAPVGPLPPSPREAAALAEFRSLHDATCARGDRVNFPDGCVSPEPPPDPLCGPFGRPKPPPRSARRPHGYFERTGPYGELEAGDTLSCCHCGGHWEVRAGSGKTRGFCAPCFSGRPGSGYTCGRPGCDLHVPVERRLENLEAGRALLTPPAPKAAVPELPPGFAGAVLLTSEVAVGPGSIAAAPGGSALPQPQGGIDAGLGVAPGGPGGGAAGPA